MIVNRQTLLDSYPILGMVKNKVKSNGVTYGMSEAGYDIRIKQSICFGKNIVGSRTVIRTEPSGEKSFFKGRFVIASAVEPFNMPNKLIGIVHDKSSWARRGLSVFNTCIESGWKGFLTLELVYHGEETLIVPSGAGIAQVIFHETTDSAAYSGRYQDQKNQPQSAIPA